MSQAEDNRNKPRCARDDAAAVLARLRDAGHTAYFAGGCVRDLLLGYEPKDYDVATDATPKRVRELFSHTQAVGAAFGVMLVHHAHSVVEVVTFRSEGKYLDGRRPSEVSFSTPEADAQRRDFTINGLFLDPLDNDRIIDLVGGQADIAARRLRAIGNPAERFAEDHLRLLRAVRFASRFSLEIDPATADAMLASAHSLKAISPERIAEELRLMWTPLTRTTAWPLLWRFKLVDVIFRFLPLPVDVEFAPARSIFLTISPGQPISFGLALAAAAIDAQLQSRASADFRYLLEHPQARHATQSLNKALRLSNEESDEMRQCLEGLDPLLQDEPPPVAKLKRFLARPTAWQSRAILDVFAALGHFAPRIAWLRSRFGELETTDYAPTPLLTGDDLTAAGLPPGPIFKKILEAVYDAQLEGRITSRAEALATGLQMANP